MPRFANKSSSDSREGQADIQRLRIAAAGRPWSRQNPRRWRCR